MFGNPGYLGVQRIDSSGQVVWNSGGITVFDFTEEQQNKLQSFPFVEQVTKGLITDGAGGCFVWRALPVTGYSRVQHVDSNGNLTWGTDGVTYWQRQTEDAPLVETELCPDGNEGIMAVFDNMGWKGMEDPYGVEFGVRVQRISSGGQKLFDQNGVVVREWPNDSLYISLLTACSVPGGVIVAWDDNRHNPEFSLYAQIVDTTGKVGSGINEEPTPAIVIPTLEIASIVNSERLYLRFCLPVGESGTLKLFNVSGCQIRTQDVNQQEDIMGWDVSNVPSGVYFAQLVTTNNARVRRKVVVIK